MFGIRQGMMGAWLYKCSLYYHLYFYMPETFHSKNIFKEDGMNMRDTVIETEYRTGRRLKCLEFLVWETG